MEALAEAARGPIRTHAFSRSGSALHSHAPGRDAIIAEDQRQSGLCVARAQRAGGGEQPFGAAREGESPSMGMDRRAGNHRMANLLPSRLADADAPPLLAAPERGIMDREEMKRQGPAPAKPFGNREIRPKEGQPFRKAVASAKAPDFIKNGAGQPRGALAKPAKQDMATPGQTGLVTGAGEMEDIAQLGLVTPGMQETRGCDSGVQRDPHAQRSEKNGLRAQDPVKGKQRGAGGEGIIPPVPSRGARLRAGIRLPRLRNGGDPWGKRLDIQRLGGWQGFLSPHLPLARFSLSHLSLARFSLARLPFSGPPLSGRGSFRDRQGASGRFHQLKLHRLKLHHDGGWTKEIRSCRRACLVIFMSDKFALSDMNGLGFQNGDFRRFRPEIHCSRPCG